MMASGNTMTPNEALNLLFAMSTLAPVKKQTHLDCEQAKAVLDVSLKRLAELSKKTKPKGDK